MVAPFSSSLAYLRCPKCYVSVCSFCVLTREPEAEAHFLDRYASFSRLLPFQPQNSRFYTGFANI